MSCFFTKLISQNYNLYKNLISFIKYIRTIIIQLGKIYCTIQNIYYIQILKLFGLRPDAMLQCNNIQCLEPRRKLENVVFNVSVKLISRFHHICFSNDHIDTITKVNFPTTNQLLDFLNASRKYLFTETWGYRKNNTWSGMTGYLVRQEVDIGGKSRF